MRKNLFKTSLLASAFVFSVNSASAQEYSLRVAHALAPSEPIHKAAESFAEAVNERTNGKMRITVFPSEQLGPNRDVLEQVRQGAPIIHIADPGFMADYVPDFGVLNGPYLIDKPEDFEKLISSDWYENELMTQTQEKGFQVLAFNYFFGARHMLGNEPYRSPDDLNGVTMRIPPNPIWTQTFGALGARGTPLPWTEVYSALAQNVVDAVEAPLGSLEASKLYEPRKTLSLTNHFTAYLGLVMNSDTFESYPEEIQDILLEEAKSAGEEMTEMTISRNDEILTKLKSENVTVIEDIDINAFRQATASVYDEFPEWSPGLHEKIRNILDQ